MKWFKHDTDALHDAKIEKLIMKHGVEGYGVYFACVEMIANQIKPSNATFELEHDAEILSHKFRIDIVKVEEIMLYCIQLGLFGQSELTGKITCYKLANRLDDYSTKNPEIKKIVAKFNGTTDIVSTNSEQNTTLYPTDKNRLEENREDKNRIDKDIYHQNKYFTVTVNKHTQYGNKYKLADIDTEYEFMERWLDNKGADKIKDYNKFIHNWLRKTNDKIKDNAPDDYWGKRYAKKT